MAADILAGIIGPEPPGRARPLVLLCHGQETFQTPSLLTYVHLPEFDFINPDCHLLGKYFKLEMPLRKISAFFKIYKNSFVPIQFFPKDENLGL